jgi:glycerophosphoryl diester phosphodiesterase
MDWRPTGRLRIGGHRGARLEAPENTLAGFELAAAAGVDYVELDVRRTADDILVVIHDGSLRRTTDGHGRVETTALADLARLDAGAWFDRRFVAQRIPTLDAFLAWLEAHAPLGAVLEAKGRGTGARIAARIATSAARPYLAICSFNAPQLRAAKWVDPTVPTLLLVDLDEAAAADADPLALTRAARANGAGLLGPRLDRKLVEWFHAAGLLVGAGTRNDADGIRAAAALGVDLLDSDRPTTAVAARAADRTAAAEP